LRRENQERLLELVCRPANRHLLFLHRLEQRGLNFRRRSVYLVGKDDVGEDRAFLDAELSIGLVIYLCPQDVSGEQIGSELNSLESSC
jgi:hypothetical protein